MLDLGVSWKFSDVQDNIEAVKNQYRGFLSSFLCYKLKERVRLLQNIKEQVFNYENIQYWQRERLWETINGDFDIEEFRRLCR